MPVTTSVTAAMRCASVADDGGDPAEAGIATASTRAAAARRHPHDSRHTPRDTPGAQVTDGSNLDLDVKVPTVSCLVQTYDTLQPTMAPVRNHSSIGGHIWGIDGSTAGSARSARSARDTATASCVQPYSHTDRGLRAGICAARA